MTTLDDLLAMLPDNDTGAIDAADLRAIVTALWDNDADLNTRVTALEEQADLATETGAWQYNSSPPPPSGSQVRLDSDDLPVATQAAFRLTDSDGADRTLLFGAAILGVRLQDWDDSSIFASYNVIGPAVLSADDATLTVAYRDGAGKLPNQKVRAIFVIDTETAS